MRRCHERLKLRISVGEIHGTGDDVDGEFRVEGKFGSDADSVTLLRRYTKSNGSPELVWVSFQYEGKWDGQMVFGHWFELGNSLNCGPFEMWPDHEGLKFDSMVEQDELVTAGPR